MRTVRLADVAQVNPRGEKPADDEAVSFVPMADLDETTARTGRGSTRQFREVSKGYTVFRDRDLLVAKITPCFENNKIAQAHLAHPTGVGSTEFHVVRPDPQVADARYLLHYLRQDRIRVQGEKRMTGSAGQRRVPTAFLTDLRIPLPSLGEQRRIAAILDQADALRAKRRQAQMLFRNLTTSIFMDMFGDPESTVRAGSGVQFPEIVADLQGGRNLVAADPHAVSRNRVLKISSVTTGVFAPTESKPLPDDYEPPADHFVRPGDLLLSRANTTELVGATAYVAEAPGNLVLPDKLWRFVWREPDQVEPLYVWALLQTPAMRRELSSRSSGTGGSMKNISKAKLATMRLPWPSHDEQLAFTTRFHEVQRLSYLASRRHEDELFASLQAKAFTGGF